MEKNSVKSPKIKRDHFTTTLDPEILKAFRYRALDEGRNINLILEEIMLAYLNKNEGQEENNG